MFDQTSAIEYFNSCLPSGEYNYYSYTSISGKDDKQSINTKFKEESGVEDNTADNIFLRGGEDENGNYIWFIANIHLLENSEIFTLLTGE